jgi:DNA-directed RNA polymerase specialized sigma24 family protein
VCAQRTPWKPVLSERWCDPSEEVQAKLDAEALAARLVKRRERAVFRMRMHDDMSVEEIAQALGKSEPWVKVQLRAIRHAWNAMNRELK